MAALPSDRKGMITSLATNKNTSALRRAIRSPTRQKAAEGNAQRRQRTIFSSVETAALRAAPAKLGASAEGGSRPACARAGERNTHRHTAAVLLHQSD